MQIMTIQGITQQGRQWSTGSMKSMSRRGWGGGAAWERLQQEAGLGLRLKDQERDLPGIQEQGEVFKTEPGEISKLDFLNV